METKQKTFDAVAASRQWREATSRKLDALSREQRLIYLKTLGEQCRAEIRARRKSLATAAS
jgi:hypothetical protein